VEQARKRKASSMTDQNHDIFDKFAALLKQDGSHKVKTNEDELVEMLENLPFDDDKWSSDSEDDSISDDKIE
jgi:hypothetical protein